MSFVLRHSFVIRHSSFVIIFTNVIAIYAPDFDLANDAEFRPGFSLGKGSATDLWEPSGQYAVYAEQDGDLLESSFWRDAKTSARGARELPSNVQSSRIILLSIILWQRSASRSQTIRS